MPFRKVQANRTYIYDPCLLDQIDRRTNLRKGAVVHVQNLPGCPKANTMGHCHVSDPETGQFLGLVCSASLQPMSEAPRILAELKSQLAEML